MQCPKCNHNNRDEAIFCEKCGTKLQLICPKCGNELRPEAIFCDKCGAKLGEASITSPPRLEDMQKQLQDRIPQSLADKLFAGAKEMQGEYRLVTALFADVVGSSGMAREMPLEQYVQRMNDCFKMMVDTISIKYEGSINRFIGDCVLAFFGAPITHENDAERAVLAALDIRDSVKELGLDISIGINTGTTYVGEMGSDLYLERSAWGPDVDMAKRLQESANPGHIWVGEPTYRLVSRAFDFAAPVDFRAKGVDSVAYPVLSAREHPEKLRGIEGLRARMIGREHEFADLKEAADLWLAGQGQMVSIVGEAGIGKSRLVQELREYLRKRVSEGASGTVSASVLEGRCVSIGQPISYWPFLDILHTWFGLGEDDSEAERVQKVRERIQELMPDRGDDILPYLGHLMNLKFGHEIDTKLEGHSPEQVSHHTMMRLRDIFVALSQKQKLLLVLEDLHWADDLSLDLVSLLMDELMAHPLMLLCVYRPEQKHRVWRLGSQAQRKCLERYREIQLQKLPPASSRRLVQELLDIDDLPEGVRGMILTKSEGNPFFIEEVIRSLIERELVYREDDRWRAKEGIAHISVPDTIQSVVLARVDRLASEAKYVLQCASVIGRLFKHRLLEHLTQKQKELDGYITEFEERDLIYEERTIPELEYAFKHALTQEATYQGILEQRRKAFHREVAQGIERLYHERIQDFYEELAYHWERSGDNEKTLEYLIKAGQKAAGSYLNDAAVNYYTQALDLAKEMDISGDKLAGIYEARGWVYDNMNFREEAIFDMMRAGELYTQRSRRAFVYHQISGIYKWYIGSDKEAVQYARMALEEVDESDKSWEAARVYGVAPIFVSLHIEEAEQLIMKGIAISEEMGYRDLLAMYYGHLHYLYWNLPRVHEIIERRRIAYQKATSYLPYLKHDLTLYSNICAILASGSDDIEEEMHLQQESLDAGVKSGHSWGAVPSARWLGIEYFRSGEVQKAMDVWELGWHIGVRARHVFWGFFTKLTRDLMRLYQSEGKQSRILDMMLEMVDSTLVLHGKPQVHPTIQHRWNDIVEEILKALHSINPEIYGKLERWLESRLSDSDTPGEQFFYHGQLAIIAMLNCHRDLTETHLYEMLRLLPSAGIYANRISKRIHCLIELIDTSSEQRHDMIEKMVGKISWFPDLQYIVDAIRFLMPDEAVTRLIDWDHVNHLALEYLKTRPRLYTAWTFLEIGRVYKSYENPDALNELAEKVQTVMANVLREEGTNQLVLEPVQPGETRMAEITEDFSQDPMNSNWKWIDPVGDCQRLVKGYLEINPPPEHDLWLGSNLNAPRLLRAISGDFCIETKISDGSEGTKLGGLLVWSDEYNFARFEISAVNTQGTWYKGAVYYCVCSSDKIMHPGVNSFQADLVWLRLERKGDRFTGYVSSDGDNWYRCGWADIPMENPIQVGVHALCPQLPATSTRFEYFRIYRPE